MPSPSLVQGQLDPDTRYDHVQNYSHIYLELGCERFAAGLDRVAAEVNGAVAEPPLPLRTCKHASGCVRVLHQARCWQLWAGQEVVGVGEWNVPAAQVCSHLPAAL